MTDSNSLRNEGVLVLNEPSSDQTEKTVVVLGPARSGTTMVASVLQAFGIPMGENLGPVLEDLPLSRAVESGNVTHVKEIVAERNAAHPIWGWKRPSALEHTDSWRPYLRNPYIIAIFRDPFAIANRNRISMLSDLFQNMEQSVERLATMVQMLRNEDAPILLCSYEKALVYPECFVGAIDNFLALNSEDRHGEAIQKINPASARYLETSRITNSLGHLGLVDKKLCSGWAFYPRQPRRAAKVNIYVNDRLVYVTDATLPRPDVKRKGLHPTGLCGFRFEWPDDSPPRSGDWVDVRAEGDTSSLTGSPKQVR